MKTQTHTGLVRQCLDFLKLRNIVAWQNNTSGLTRKVKGRVFMQKSPAKGTADILGILAPCGRFLAVECKIPPDKPRPEQRAFLDNIRASGGVALVVHDVSELIEWYDRVFVGGAPTPMVPYED